MTTPTEYQDHDQRFKALIREFFADFLRLFFDDWARRFDLTSVEWLDTELLPDPPDGARHKLDLVAKLRALEPIDPDAADPTTWLALVHIEVESPDRTTQLKPRLPAYYLHLTERYDLPVLPVVLYLKVGMGGVGTDAVVRRFWQLEVLRMQYLYVGLPGLDGEAFIRGDNWLGVALAALMRLPPERAGELGLEALRRIGGSTLTEQQQYLLSECVETYLPVEDAEMERIAGIVEGEIPGRSSTMQRNRTRYDRAWEGGQRVARLEMLEAQIATKFGPLSAEQLTALRAKSDAELVVLGVKVLSANSPSDLGL
jgi:hypothetical protein